MNDYQLDEYCRSIAEEIVRDAETECQAMDWASEKADSSEYAIYIHKAHDLCQNCDTSYGEELVAECWTGVAMTYGEMACRIAYCEIDSRIRSFVWQLWQEKEGDAA